MSIFKHGESQAVHLPADMAYEGVAELEISREGDVITLRAARPFWASLQDLPKGDADFLRERTDVISDD